MFTTALAPAFLALFSKSVRAARKAALHAFMSSVRRVRAFPWGVTVPSFDAIGGMAPLPKRNLTEPSGFCCASVDSSASLIGNTYLSSREYAGVAIAIHTMSALERATLCISHFLLHDRATRLRFHKEQFGDP